MATLIDAYHRLESRSNDRDLQNGFAARIHDPLWLLTRQWQMGEHQGENASSPARVDSSVTQTSIQPIDGNPAFDPAVVPPEALVESELDDWWTMGRRIRVGQRFANRPEVTVVEGLRFRDPAPPYEAFRGHVDGRAVWNAHERLNVPVAAFGEDAPPEDSPIAWDPFRLNYQRSFESSEGRLVVRDHHGGPMDWYSADGDVNEVAGAPAAPKLIAGLPVPLEYPGAPHSRFWEIEDAQVDIGGYAPDTAHFATMLLVDLVYSHGDDWFLFPITGRAGHILSIQSLTVTDAFGRVYSSDEFVGGAPKYPGLRPPADFTIFKCKGLQNESLVLWPVAESPLESQAIECVQFGVDEHSNVMWALERIIDARQVDRAPAAPNASHSQYPPRSPIGDATKAKTYEYLPGTGTESRWHPYHLDWNHPTELAFVQQGLADYSLQQPRPMPHPEAEVLKAGPPNAPELHRIAAATIAQGGLELERRWQLARDLRGAPVLWIQRQRRILRTPPARPLRFDVMQESANRV